MDILWAPWRMAYIKRKRGPAEQCIFCAMATETGDDAAIHVIARSSRSFVVLNRFPYSNGHLMIVPYEHVASPEELPDADLADMAALTNRSLRVLRAVCRPSAFNTGANIGADAGAGIADHYHFHIVPRWAGDSNFMTSIGNTRVIPDSLDNLYKELKTAWEGLNGD